MMINIRKANEQDAEIIEEITIKSWNDTYKSILPKDFLDNMVLSKEKSIKITKKKIEQFYIIENEVKVLGFARVTEVNESTGEINSLYMDLTEKQKGYGRKLLNYIFQNNKYNKYILTVFAENSANEFYNKMGGKIIEQSKFKISNNEYPVNIYEFNIKDC